MPIQLPREAFVGMVENTISRINSTNMRNPFISAAFEMCGQNPWATESSIRNFHSYLERLESNEVMKVLNNLKGNGITLD
jgi:hypothetical protein